MIEGAMTAAHEGSRTAGARAGLAGQGWSDPLASPATPRILLVDDEPQISGFVGRALEHAGYRVDVADDAVSGVRLAAGAGDQGGVPGPGGQGLPDQAVLPGRANRAGPGQAARERQAQRGHAGRRADPG